MGISSSSFAADDAKMMILVTDVMGEKWPSIALDPGAAATMALMMNRKWTPAVLQYMYLKNIKS